MLRPPRGPAEGTWLGVLGPGSSRRQGLSPSIAAERGWRPFTRRNELFALPGVGEDEPVIIFKFAIIDLGKSYCDKNELIIKFISEINSVAIKPLAGDAGAADGSRLPVRQVPAPSRAGSAGGGGGGRHHSAFPPCSLPPCRRGSERFLGFRRVRPWDEATTLCRGRMPTPLQGRRWSGEGAVLRQGVGGRRRRAGRKRGAQGTIPQLCSLPAEMASG